MHTVEGMIQVTQPLNKGGTVTVSGSACPAPYKCSKCKHGRISEDSSPMHKVFGCGRDNKTAEISAVLWMESLAKRLSRVLKCKTEIHEVTPGDIALFRGGVGQNG